MAYVSTAPRTPKGHEQLTVSSSSVALASVPDGANYALIRVSGANVRYRDDGTAPTTSAGMPLKADDVLEYPGDAKLLRFIRDDSSDATLDVAYYRA